MPKKKEHMGLNKEQRIHLVRATKSVEKLDAFWEDWMVYGFSPRGQLHSLVLARKAELGVELSEGELALIQATKAQVAHGKNLPPIKGEGPGRVAT